MTRSGGRFHLGKLLGILLLAFGASAAAVYAWIQIVATRRFSAMERRVAGLRALHPARLPRAAETPGEMDQKFIAMIQEARRKTAYCREAFVFIRYDRGNWENLEILLQETQPVLDLLHQGCQGLAAGALVPAPNSRDWVDSAFDLVSCSVVIRARERRLRNAPSEAVEVLLEFIRFARCSMESADPSERIRLLYLLEAPFDELRSLLSSEQLSESAFLKIEEECDALESRLNWPFLQLEPDLASWGEDLLKQDLDGIGEGWPYRWRYVLPVRLMKAEAFDLVDQKVRRILACEGRPYLELLNTVRGMTPRREDSLNPIIRNGSFLDDPTRGIELYQMARVRLLRMGSRFRRTGELLDIEDPFGGKLAHSGSGDWCKLWSRDSDGMDDGGDDGRLDSWLRGPQPGEAASIPKDIVIKVRRSKP